MKISLTFNFYNNEYNKLIIKYTKLITKTFSIKRKNKRIIANTCKKNC